MVDIKTFIDLIDSDHITPVPPGDIRLREWNILIIEHDGQTIEKFLGYDTRQGDYRISSQILEYDLENMTGRTQSGSMYTFIGLPGKLHPKAQYVFDKISALEETKVKLRFPEA